MKQSIFWIMTMMICIVLNLHSIVNNSGIIILAYIGFILCMFGLILWIIELTKVW
jgi:hypothetical protein